MSGSVPHTELGMDTIAGYPAPPGIPADRLLSLDAFRGITIAFMILVENPGSSEVYGPLAHSEWDGWTLTDLVFPFFLYIVGVAISLSLGHRLGRSESQRRLFLRIARRTLIIFALGIILNGFPYYDLSGLRIPGVLQRIAICYFAASLLVLTVSVRIQALIAASLLIGYWLIVQMVPVPGGGVPGGPDMLEAYIDSAVLPGHLLYGWWDPEGILSTPAALVTTLSGVLTGHWLLSPRSTWERVCGLFVMGNVCLVLGLLWDPVFPINKKLWTSSYVLFTDGMALQFFGMCFWAVDIKGYRRWVAPFIVYGANAILAYMLSSLVDKATLFVRVPVFDGTEVMLRDYIVETLFLPFTSPVNASLLYAAGYMLLWLGVAVILYRRRIFIKI
jgi:predicted acyltransferase